MSLYRRAIPRKIQPRKPAVIGQKKIMDDIVATSELFKKYDEFLHTMVANLAMADANTMNLYCKIQNIDQILMTFTSKMDAITYKLDEFQRNVMNLQGSLYGVQNMQYTIDPLLSQVNSMSSDIHAAFANLKNQVSNMESIVKGLDDIAKDPVMNRTIEELKTISSIV